jgi:excisionase family DNA binding protein
MTVKDVAARLGVSSRAVRRWALEGRLPPDDKFPGPKGGYLFHPATVELLARQREKEKAAAS